MSDVAIFFYPREIKPRNGAITKWIFFTMFFRQWPSEEFGTLVDYFQAFTPSPYPWISKKNGMSTELYQPLASTLLGKKKYAAHLNVDSKIVQNGQLVPYPYIYPMPLGLAKLVQPGVFDHGDLAHPSLLENVDTEHFMKMLKFKIWADSKVNKNEFRTLSEVIKAETQVFEDFNFTKKLEFQVKLKSYAHLREYLH